MSDYEAGQRAAEYTLEHRGGTFDAATLAPVYPTSGYAVAVESLGRGNGALASPSYVAERLRAASNFARSIPFIGVWVNRNHVGNDIVHIDRVVILPDLESALILGRAFNQLAIYDFANKEDIRVR